MLVFLQESFLELLRIVNTALTYIDECLLRLINLSLGQLLVKMY